MIELNDVTHDSKKHSIIHISIDFKCLLAQQKNVYTWN